MKWTRVCPGKYISGPYVITGGYTNTNGWLARIWEVRLDGNVVGSDAALAGAKREAIADRGQRAKGLR
jgi:hypothetical protein